MDYTVLVVEDEENQRRTLVQKVDWASAGFRVVGEAKTALRRWILWKLWSPTLLLPILKCR